MYKYVAAMTFNKKTALRKLSGYDNVFSEHLSKLVMYSDLSSDYVEDWIGDIAKAISNMSKTASHSSLSYDDYFDNCFDDFGYCTIDEAGATLASQVIRLSRKPVDPFPYRDYTDEQEEKMSNVMALLRQELSSYLSETSTTIPIPEAKKFVVHILECCGV